MKAPKSNTWVTVTPIALWFIAGLIYVGHFQESTQGKYDYLLAAGISLFFLSTAAAQIRSGYLWQNGAPGNRGKHRTAAPKTFVFSTAFNILLGVAIVIFFCLQHIRQN